MHLSTRAGVPTARCGAPVDGLVPPDGAAGRQTLMTLALDASVTLHPQTGSVTLGLSTLDAGTLHVAMLEDTARQLVRALGDALARLDEARSSAAQA